MTPALGLMKKTPSTQQQTVRPVGHAVGLLVYSHEEEHDRAVDWCRPAAPVLRAMVEVCSSAHVQLASHLNCSLIADGELSSAAGGYRYPRAACRSRGNRYILVVEDYFTKCVNLYPLPNQMARWPLDDYVLVHPEVLHSDQGQYLRQR
ncbi:hypothetical protein EYF80_042774 [Liparis tanakae]|uniref:Uncharacterized protein n=1 Tax=Liparis tanakae TaxID=230148 RepID=A0A4Z2G191_9TELE|nr:hypothetical protein EYF80_042774 [Liparis tanakae]